MRISDWSSDVCSSDLCIAERVSRTLAGDVFPTDARRAEALVDLIFQPPADRADEAFRRWRGVGGADLQDTGDERRVPGYPVAHDDASARAGHAHHLARSVERPGGEHRAKHADHQIETPVGEIIERRSVALLAMQIVQSRFTGATNPCRNKVRVDVDANHPGATPRGWPGGDPVAATKARGVTPRANNQIYDE